MRLTCDRYFLPEATRKLILMNHTMLARIAHTLTILALVTAPLAGWGQDLSPQHVEQGIEQATRYLKSNQLPDGGWPEFNGTFPDGVSALVTLALLNSGAAPDQPEIARALQFLSRRELEKTYTVSLQTMVFCAANPNKYANQIRRNAEWLGRAQLANGGWSYDLTQSGGDPSNSQFALLALHEAQRSGVANFPMETWRTIFGRAREYWSTLQNRDGSFPYESKGSGRGSMTCAGIASLVIVGDQLAGLESTSLDVLQCCGGEFTEQDRIALGLKWLGDNFSVHSNPGHQMAHLYYLYALERVGRLTGRRFIGDSDWYRQGALQLLNMQDKITGRIVGSSNAYLGLIDALLQEESAENRAHMLEESGDLINDEFMQLLGGLIGQLEQQGEQPEMLDKVKELNREILRFTMKRNLQNS